jgi:hypothetical protein
VACRVASAVGDVLSESESTLADGVVLRPGERDRDCDDVDNADDDVVERRRGAVSAGPWYVRADNAIRMSRGGGSVCVRAARLPWNAVWESQTHASWARRAAGAGWSSAAAASRVEGWWCRYSHCTGDEEVKLYTDNGSGRRGGLLKWP